MEELVELFGAPYHSSARVVVVLRRRHAAHGALGIDGVVELALKHHLCLLEDLVAHVQHAGPLHSGERLRTGEARQRDVDGDWSLSLLVS